MAKLNHCEKCCVNDSICVKTDVTDREVVYANNTRFPVNGTFVVENPSSNPAAVDVQFDSSSIGVAPGKARTFTVTILTFLL